MKIQDPYILLGWKQSEASRRLTSESRVSMSHAKLLKGLCECCHCPCEMPRLWAKGHAKAMWLSEAQPLALAEGCKMSNAVTLAHARVQ